MVDTFTWTALVDSAPSPSPERGSTADCRASDVSKDFGSIPNSHRDVYEVTAIALKNVREHAFGRKLYDSTVSNFGRHYPAVEIVGKHIY